MVCLVRSQRSSWIRIWIRGFCNSGKYKCWPLFKNDLVARVTHGKLDFGKESKSSASIGIESIKYLNLSIQEGFYHSDLCNLYDVYPNPNHDIASCPNTIKYDETPDLSFDIIGVELYCIVGFSFNLSYDFEYVLEGLYGT